MRIVETEEKESVSKGTGFPFFVNFQRTGYHNMKLGLILIFIILMLCKTVFAADIYDNTMSIPEPEPEDFYFVPEPKLEDLNFTSEAETEDTENVVTTPVKKSNTPAILLIGADVIMGAYTLYALIEQWRISGEYVKLHEKLDNTSYKNYCLLVVERKKVDDANMTVCIAAGITLACVLYTLIDLDNLHFVFPEQEKLSIGCDFEKIIVAYRREF